MIASSCSISGRRTDISLLILQRVAASSLFVAYTILLVPSGLFKTIGVLMMVFKVEIAMTICYFFYDSLPSKSIEDCLDGAVHLLKEG